MRLRMHGEYIPPMENQPVCEEYEEAGRDAISGDGLPQCAGCGWSKSLHKNQERIVVGEGKGPLAGISIVLGQHIQLNYEARDWRAGKTFYVKSVHDWGVNCWLESSQGIATYMARWNEIQGVM